MSKEQDQSIFTDVALEVSKQLKDISESFKDIAPVPFMKRKAPSREVTNGQKLNMG